MQPLQAVRAMRKLLANPDDTPLVFEILRALSGDSFERLFQRVMSTPDGRRILEQERSLLDELSNLERLRTLPEETLGREYARYLDDEQIDAAGLVEASERDDDSVVFLDERASVLSARMRDMHDLWHVVCGYERDMIGEGALLAFTYAQARNPGLAFIVLMAALKMWREGVRQAPKLMWEGYRRGRRATFLPAVCWEDLLAEPVEELRRRFRLDPAPSYEPRFSDAGLAVRADNS